MFIDHVSMYADKPEELKDFYTRYFDGESNEGVTNGDTLSYFLSFGGGGTAKLEIVNREDIRKKLKNHVDLGYIRLSFMLDSEDAVNNKINEIKEAGYQVLKEPFVDDDGYYKGLILDPGDNQVEILYGAPGGLHCPVDKQRKH